MFIVTSKTNFMFFQTAKGVPAYTQLRTSIFECPKNKNVLNREKCNEKHASPGLGL